MTYIEMLNKIYEDYKTNGTLSNESVELFEQLHEELNKPAETKPLTENGIKIIQFMREDGGSNYKAKDIADGMGINSRSVSGSMKKLVTEGFVEKIGKDPILYNLTDKGREYSI